MTQLLDSYRPRWSRDDLMETRLGLRAWYNDPTGGDGGAGGDDGKGGAPDDASGGGAANNDGADELDKIDLDKVDPEKLAKLIDDRNRKGRKALEAEKENKRLQAELKKYQDADEERRKQSLTAEEAAREKAAEMERENARLQTELENERIRTQVIRAGADAELVDVITDKLVKEKAGKSDLDVGARLKELQETRKAWFSGNGNAPKEDKVIDTAGGHKRTGGANSESKIAELEAKLKSGIEQGTLSVGQKAALLGQIEMLRLHA